VYQKLGLVVYLILYEFLDEKLARKWVNMFFPHFKFIKVFIFVSVFNHCKHTPCYLVKLSNLILLNMYTVTIQVNL
jgi:hypothetical protein